MDQILALKMIVEKQLEKGSKLFVTVMGLQKACDRIGKKHFWDDLRIDGVGWGFTWKDQVIV